MILDRLEKLVRELAGSARASGALDASTPLRDGGLWLDSVALLELVVAVEREFRVDFEPSDLSDASLRTLGSLADVIERRLAGR
ncbi:MAG TPA: acyl carrier protein [Methylomirabilota bacterium]|nr:acyl carrier protein [Methylomirabilota bacterium]